MNRAMTDVVRVGLALALTGLLLLGLGAAIGLSTLGLYGSLAAGMLWIGGLLTVAVGLVMTIYGLVRGR
jgi:hypothetical protein